MALAVSYGSRDYTSVGRSTSNNTKCNYSNHWLQHVAPLRAAALPLCVAAAVGAGWGWARPQQLLSKRWTTCCCDSASSVSQPPTSRIPQQNSPQLQQQPILIALGTSSEAAAKAIVLQLRTFGISEVWATSAANHFTAIQALAEAHMQLAEQEQSLAAIASLSASDQEKVDEQKRGLKKLTLQLQLHQPTLNAAVWTAGAANNISTNRTRSVTELVQAMREKLEQQGSSSKDGAAVVLEARGEQAVTRALKALLSLQASQQGSLLLRPWQGQVVDVVAEKRGEQRLAGGLLLHASWNSENQLAGGAV